MAYDEKLAQRVRELIGEEPGIEEKKMFGGLAFMTNGHMGLAVSGQGGLMVRAAHETAEVAIANGDAAAVKMTGREMRGWLRIDADHLATKRQLRRWVSLGMDYAATFPPKG